MDYSVRSGERDDLVATLLRFAADRAERGEVERCAEARAAADALGRGGDAAYFERAIWAVGAGDGYSVFSGSVGEVLAELDEHGRGLVHNGSLAKAASAARALDAVRGGARVARVGHIVYVVRG